MSPFQILRRYASALYRRRPTSTAQALFMTGVELGLKMAQRHPSTAAKLVESIDIEAHGGDNPGMDDTLVSIVNDIAQLRQN